MTLSAALKYSALLAQLLAAPALFAAGDTLTPDEVKTTGISSTPDNESAFFIGAGATFGQARTTEPGSDPGTAYWLQVEPGYQVKTGSWSRFEASVELLAGSLNYSLPNSDATSGKVTLTGLSGALAKVGYGYSLGHDMFGVLKAGVGPAFTTWEISPDSGGTAKSDSLSGLVWTAGWELVGAINHSFDFTAGVSWTQYQFHVSSLTYNGSKLSVDGNVLANVPAADIGVRFRL